MAARDARAPVTRPGRWTTGRPIRRRRARNGAGSSGETNISGPMCWSSAGNTASRRRAPDFGPGPLQTDKADGVFTIVERAGEVEETYCIVPLLLNCNGRNA